MNASLQNFQPNGTSSSRFWQEWLGNALYFPLLNILLELLSSDQGIFPITADFVSLLAGSLFQAFALSHWEGFGKNRRLMGNLIGPAVYTALGLALSRAGFLQNPSHIAYWLFSLLIGILQGARAGQGGWLRGIAFLLETSLRGAAIMLMGYLLALRLDPVIPLNFPTFAGEPVNLFFSFSAILLGLYAGLLLLTNARQQDLLSSAAQDLKTYAEWLFGRNSQGQVITNPASLAARKTEGTILCLGLRDFERWSAQRPAEELVALLNRYYQTVEATLEQHHALKVKFSGEEALASFAKVDDGLQAALRLRSQLSALLYRHGLGVGIGLHVGPLFEGWLGGKNIKVYETFGETINIAREIEASAAAGELLVSEALRIAIGTTFRAGPKRQIASGGGEEPVVIYPLE